MSYLNLIIITIIAVYYYYYYYYYYSVINYGHKSLINNFHIFWKVLCMVDYSIIFLNLDLILTGMASEIIV
jgi:hypothetical protein